MGGSAASAGLPPFARHPGDLVALRTRPHHQGLVCLAQNLALADEIVWFVDQLADVCELRAAMFERARSSPVVAEFAELFQGVLRLMLGNALRPHVEEDRLDEVVRAFSATVEGLLVQGTETAARRRIVRLTLEALTEGRLRSA